MRLKVGYLMTRLFLVLFLFSCGSLKDSKKIINFGIGLSTMPCAHFTKKILRSIRDNIDYDPTNTLDEKNLMNSSLVLKLKSCGFDV